MKKLLLLLTACVFATAGVTQTTKTELYDLVKKMITDSTGYENVGDWGVGNAKKFPVKWKEDRIIMSEDTSINFYRMGAAAISINSREYVQNGKPVQWNVMLKGPRMGYTSFSIISTPAAEMKPVFTVDSVFGKHSFNAKLLKSCDAKTLTGYYYYELKLSKKDKVFMKLSWLQINGATAMRVDVYDTYSQYAVKLDCAK